jgi:hypothetical protein
MSAKLVPTFADRGVAWSAQRIPTAVNLDFLVPEPLLFHSGSSSFILYEAESQMTAKFNK